MKATAGAKRERRAATRILNCVHEGKGETKSNVSGRQSKAFAQTNAPTPSNNKLPLHPLDTTAQGLSSSKAEAKGSQKKQRQGRKRVCCPLLEEKVKLQWGSLRLPFELPIIEKEVTRERMKSAQRRKKGKQRMKRKRKVKTNTQSLVGKQTKVKKERFGKSQVLV